MLKKIILVTVSVFMFSSDVFALDYGLQDTIDNSRLSNIENILFGKESSSLSSTTRISAIERKLFGTSQSGSLDDRINFVNKVISNSGNNYYPYSMYNGKIKHQNVIRRRLKNYLNGQMTGITPPVYNAFSSVSSNVVPRRYVVPNYYNYNKTIPQPYYDNGINNFVTQTSVKILED